MKKLKKKQIQQCIELGQDAALVAAAEKRDVSKADLIHESSGKHITTIPVEDDPAMGLVGLGNSGKRDLSEKHDRYVAKYAHSLKK